MHIVCVELPIHTCSAGPSALPVICLGGCCGERMGYHGVCRGFKCRMCGELCSSLWDFDETKRIPSGSQKLRSDPPPPTNRVHDD